MRKRIAAGLIPLSVAMIVAFSAGEQVSAQAQAKDKKAVPPKFLYGHDLRVRMGGKPDFDKDTPRIGVEFYHDEVRNAIIAISESGALAVTPAGEIGTDRTCKWLTAHDLSARKVGEIEFTQKTKKYGVELFRDLGTNQLLYVCQTATLAFAPVPAGLVTDKGPKWHHAYEARVRAHEQVSFDNAKKIGIEVFTDENTGGLMYITEPGGIATAPAPATEPDSKRTSLPPKTLYGLELRVRGATEPDFTDKTRWIEVEVFEDQNANNLLFYITEAGYITTAPNPGKIADEKGVTWKASIVLKARKGGEKNFDLANKYGIEVFVDNRTGNLLYVCETGSVAVLPKQ
jgi:hypothetical protein